MIWLWVGVPVGALAGLFLFALLITARREDHGSHKRERAIDPFSDVDVTVTRNGP
jgi:hypothetical protein